MVEQGVLSYNERISTYWPEFGQGNKENVTLMDLVRRYDCAFIYLTERHVSFDAWSSINRCATKQV